MRTHSFRNQVRARRTMANGEIKLWSTWSRWLFNHSSAVITSISASIVQRWFHGWRI